MRLRIWDVEHGACAMLRHFIGETGGRIAMVDSGSSSVWNPSAYLQEHRHSIVDYLFISNADQDHMSDLAALRSAGIRIGTLYRNPSYTGAQMRAIKEQGGKLTWDAEQYVAMCDEFVHPVPEPFDDHMGGISATLFWNKYPFFTNTNDLSLVVFMKFGSFKILFSGDLEEAGWKSLLGLQLFRDELRYLDVLVASHHGRESGFCSEVFDYCRPSAVVISDKPIAHETQETVPDYRAVVTATGVPVRTSGKRRHVLTTRRDGWIQFNVGSNGYYSIDTEYTG
jgi:beta-lactamase superfamily II metal-dependent hydrolase